jgi:hypothetical protein
MFEATPIDPFSERAIAAKAGFSVSDYGRQGTEGPYQVVMPTYPAPRWLRRFAALGPALRECDTLCQLKGKPFRVVRWGREGSGARGGIPCAACRTEPRSRFPRVPCRRGKGYLAGYPAAHPIAEYRPKGQKLVYDACGNPQVVGKPNYVVSHNPFPKLYQKETYPQRYLEAVAAAQKIAQGSGRRTFICSGFGSKPSTKRGVPVVYVDPGGLALRYPEDETGTTVVNPVSPQYFQQLVAESRGRSYLGQGA